ncbi:hypothetical protein [Sporichthya sp.]|uniref:hypothetical protein n=1 Tax=Sporichthya sp. TaxID=65475 RepID=UPI00182BEA98|nr:hypothetical protein [Sporichthya sp.]MBA3745543.1 hypothetical protein [Sporichthya sp.]
MTDGSTTDRATTDPFGAAAEEAARLVDALGQWLGARSAARPNSGIDLGYLTTHIATGAAECKLCPLCQLISLARQSSPELGHRLEEAMEAVLALARTALEGLEGQRAAKPEGSGFETIKIT